MYKTDNISGKLKNVCETLIQQQKSFLFKLQSKDIRLSVTSYEKKIGYIDDGLWP